tara:strand:- start:17212 stop:18183 length:972 start_codon:yes stop_codon:yes gene_type:complete
VFYYTIDQHNFIDNYKILYKQIENKQFQFLYDFHLNNFAICNKRVNSIDKSFILLNKKKEPFFCFFSVITDAKEDYDSFSVSFFIEKKIGIEEKKIIIQKIEDITNVENYIFCYRDFLHNQKSDLITDHLISKQFDKKLRYSKLIDLKKTEIELKKNLRRSFKSLINYGLKNFNLIIFNEKNITQEIFDKFRTLHIKESGRETRPKSSWDIQFKMIQNKNAFLIGSQINTEFVSFALFYLTDYLCSYGVSVSNRDLFNKPLSHSLVWLAILHAKKLGCEFFDLGDVISGDDNTKKEENIQQFKNGFGGEDYKYLEIKINNSKK